jgi:hypothetical protein
MSYNKNGEKEKKQRANERRGNYFFSCLSSLFLNDISYLKNTQDPIVMEGDTSDLRAIKAMDVQIGKMMKRYSDSERISDFDMQEEAQAHMDDLRDVFARVSFKYTETPKKLQKSDGPIFDFLNNVAAAVRKTEPEPPPPVHRLEYVHRYKSKSGTVVEQSIASAMV